jgi:hypothetical protein
VDIVSEVANLGVAIAAIVGAGWASAKWWRRPRFICGIPPSIAERTHEKKKIDRKRLGHDSVATAFEHEPHCFAERFPDPNREELSESLERRLLTDRERTRSIAQDEQGRARVPILIANCGKRLAEYSASITFYADYGKVHVTDVVTETAPVYLYADRRDLVVDRERVRCADQRIVASYDDYLMDDDMRRWGDVVVLTGGRLESSLFELVVVEVMIEPDLESFFVVFSVDCTDGWIGAQTFIQGCKIARQRAADRALAEPSVPQAAPS